MRTSALLLLVCLALVAVAAAPRFYPDDPIWVDDDKAFDASKALQLEDSNGYDFAIHTLLKPGERRDVRAMNVNTLDEVPDSSWFTNRIGRRDLPVSEIVRGPDRAASISLDGWVLSGDKGSGLQPGFRMRDPAGQLYQLEVDPLSNPEMATGAEIIGTAFYHAFGYNVVDVYLAEIDPDTLTIAPTATIRDIATGIRRPFTRRDLDDILRRSPRKDDGRYRVLVSRFAAGRPLGNFRYYGTRSDDPNDIVPHEHRRELRGARVFGAWLNHDDSRGVNSLDMLEQPQKEGPGWVKHYMFDFGSTLGSATIAAQRHRAGNEYIFEHRPGWLSLVSLGLYVRPWMLIDYPDVPRSIGRFEGDSFDPDRWKPEYPNPAFDNMRPDDAFWAAKIVARFDAKMIRAIVEKAQYSDPRAIEYMTETLVKRREKVLRHWMNQVVPIVNLQLQADGTFTFDNAAISAGVATAAQGYQLEWFTLDNATDAKRNVGGATITSLRGQAPAPVLQGSDYIGVTITGQHSEHPGWSRPGTFYFRRTASGWEWVGAER
jgi:hypothetical protein